jgi:hypothetical protein
VLFLLAFKSNNVLNSNKRNQDDGLEEKKKELNNSSADSLIYKGKNFAFTKKGKISLGAGFQNDFYTNENKEGYFYTEVIADQFVNEKNKRLPLNISLVIDRSGSIEWQQNKLCKRSSKICSR